MEWNFPDEGWRKYNTNGASRGNSRVSSYAFCLRDATGVLIHAEGARIEETKNCEAEAYAIVKAPIHFSPIFFNKIIIQIDLMVMLKVLTNEWKCTWNLLNIKDKITSLL